MFNMGGQSTGSSYFGSLFGIGSSMQLEDVKALTIFVNVSRDTGLQNVCVSIDPRSWQFCSDSEQLSFRNLLSNDHDLFIKVVHEFLTAELKAISFATVTKIQFVLFLFSSVRLENRLIVQ
jgi:hypothetical protein